jgi:hypothetical protein
MSASFEPRVLLQQMGGNNTRAATEDETLLRLALWLAEVTAEACLALTPPTSGTGRGLGAPGPHRGPEDSAGLKSTT